jgi:hypothetical protein
MRMRIEISAQAIFRPRPAVPDTTSAMGQAVQKGERFPHERMILGIARAVEPSNFAFRCLGSQACSIAITGVIPTPALAKTIGCLLTSNVKLPRGALISSVSPMSTWRSR